ncbi:hypothetical protein [Muriicola sp. Z0-33]|uniref:hypothetical protein n=1 Tax=Muriicola sp. Z0-33 TaxID=2816957 RepID=UPI0022383193|nr:hypothetical protein [Muriicola sp. Z0-33]MCW5517402.1 hypothetical protein [Muriicola sp. Z0-33]
MRVFKEVQKFNQWWIQLVNLLLIGLLIYLCYSWYIKKDGVNEFGENGILIQLIVIGTIVLDLLLLYLIQLRTAIDEIGVHFQFFPFQFSKKTIRWTAMQQCYTRQYKPIKEFGGWGYRTKFGKGKAYNVKGNKGIQIVLLDGKKLLIGTQKVQDATAVINRFIQKQDEV